MCAGAVRVAVRVVRARRRDPVIGEGLRDRFVALVVVHVLVEDPSHDRGGDRIGGELSQPFARAWAARSGCGGGRSCPSATASGRAARSPGCAARWSSRGASSAAGPPSACSGSRGERAPDQPSVRLLRRSARHGDLGRHPRPVRPMRRPVHRRTDPRRAARPRLTVRGAGLGRPT